MVLLDSCERIFNSLIGDLGILSRETIMNIVDAVVAPFLKAEQVLGRAYRKMRGGHWFLVRAHIGPHPTSFYWTRTSKGTEPVIFDNEKVVCDEVY